MTSVHSGKVREKSRNAAHAVERKTTLTKASERKHKKNNKPTPDSVNEFSVEQWHTMVSIAAYFRAEARGFGKRSPEDDWYEAEAELRARFTGA